MKKFLIPSIVLLVLALIHLYIFTKSIGLNYEVSNLRVAFKKEYQKKRELNSLLSKAESLPNIEKIATGDLKMQYPQTINYIVPSKEAI